MCARARVCVRMCARVYFVGLCVSVCERGWRVGGMRNSEPGFELSRAFARVPVCVRVPAGGGGGVHRVFTTSAG